MSSDTESANVELRVTDTESPKVGLSSKDTSETGPIRIKAHPKRQRERQTNISELTKELQMIRPVPKQVATQLLLLN